MATQVFTTARAAREALLEGGASEDDLTLADARVAAYKSGREAMPKALTTRRKAATKQTRQALKDRTNMQSDVDDMSEEEEIVKSKQKRAKTAAARKPRAKAAESLGVIPETQQNQDDTMQSIEVDEDVDIIHAPTQQLQRNPQRQRAASAQPLQPRASARSNSAQPGFHLPRDRSGSASGTERERRGGDPETRRKLSEMTKKYDNLNLKYQNLQEIGKSHAEGNFEKLKRASDEKAKDANALIASLKKEIAELRRGSTHSAETATLQKQITTLTSANDRLSSDSTTLKEKLQTSQNEVKSMEAKLVAARQQVANSNTQESKTKLSQSTSSHTSEAAKEAKMKENLYSDLTGLIIRGVKRKEGEDEYDCIQTGRNGTLHFHLSVANDSTGLANPKTPSGLSYEEAEFAYEPFLDESRDKELIEILPDYLAEEICFPRNHAVKFYVKVVESMTKRIVVEEE
ncbi:hypothetical protein LTR62_002170 [Meristemomyces frigidus]|uniref:Monopolin complex subunit Csm1/Pcs1 C-terminal domain-containing protein n=1 Tax=Meristemomyces frigidus TaxID=1508187 RepID=A0AAN7T8R1_9PEZI|nr:hypothetical protein LTR62_002170 [Meristemomyces frigidus]